MDGGFLVDGFDGGKAIWRTAQLINNYFNFIALSVSN